MIDVIIIGVRVACSCCDGQLMGSLEFRCCQEVGEAVTKFSFELGLKLACIIDHSHYNAWSERIVLEQVGPLLRRKDGRSMRRGKNTPMNE